MSEAIPVSVRLTEEEKSQLKSIGDEGTLVSGIRKLLEIHQHSTSVKQSKEEELKLIEEEIKSLRKSPFGADKKEMASLEKLLEETKAKLAGSQTESIKNRLLKLMKSTG